MVPSNLKVLAKFGLCSNSSQKLDVCSLARVRKSFAILARSDFLVKNEFIFHNRNSILSRSVRYANGSENLLKLHMQRRRSIPYGDTKY